MQNENAGFIVNSVNSIHNLQYAFQDTLPEVENTLIKSETTPLPLNILQAYEEQKQEDKSIQNESIIEGHSPSQNFE
jgi:hypothetical protein